MATTNESRSHQLEDSPSKPANRRLQGCRGLSLAVFSFEKARGRAQQDQIRPPTAHHTRHDATGAG